MRESADLQVLGFGEIGFRNITNNVRPVVDARGPRRA